jgi:E217 collar protein gp28
MIPGSNLLNQALSVIASQTISYIAFVSRSKNINSVWVPTYATPVNIQGSIQPVPRTLMMELGLDLQRHYVNIYVSNKVIDIRRDVSSDQFKFQGTTYQAISLTRWFGVDGWNQVLAVEVPS